MGVFSRLLLLASTRWHVEWIRLAIVHAAMILVYVLIMHLLFSNLFKTLGSVVQPGWITAALVWIAVDVFLMLRRRRSQLTDNLR